MNAELTREEIENIRASRYGVPGGQREALCVMALAHLRSQPEGYVSAWTDVIAERRRQIEQEGWTPEHDAEHDCGEMANAAACYALNAGGSGEWRDSTIRNRLWPWSWEWWKPKEPRRDLVRAAALIVAEIERLDRAASPPAGEGADNLSWYSPEDCR